RRWRVSRRPGIGNDGSPIASRCAFGTSSSVPLQRSPHSDLSPLSRWWKRCCELGFLRWKAGFSTRRSSSASTLESSPRSGGADDSPRLIEPGHELPPLGKQLPDLPDRYGPLRGFRRGAEELPEDRLEVLLRLIAEVEGVELLLRHPTRGQER